MNPRVTVSSSQVFSAAERTVYQALDDLAVGYDAHVGAPSDSVPIAGAPPSYYQPDFVITSPSGQKLLIEVKSQYSMSLSNIAKLSSIGEAIEKEGYKFLVLIPDAVTGSVFNLSYAGLEHLNLTSVSNPSDVNNSILEILGETDFTPRVGPTV